MITKVRFGFGTNSSSSHSIVLVPEVQHSQNIPPSRHFGWGRFLAKDFEDKLTYFSLCLKHSDANYQAWEDSLEVALKPIYECYPEAKDLPTEWFDGAVDHQSVIYCPAYHDATLAVAFYRQVTWPIISNTDIGIAGGNDDTLGQGPYLPGDVAELPNIIHELKDNPSWVIRKENFGYILYNTYNGKKIRWEENNV